VIIITTNPTKYQQHYMLTYRAGKIKEMKTALGGKCTNRGCGERRLSKLEFHHVTPICRDRSLPVDNLGIVLTDYHNLRIDVFKRRYVLKCVSHHDDLNGGGNVQGCMFAFKRRKKRY